ncbi:MAG: MerR family transcriptional regulator [Lachnospiraceae bacterium]|nr:MerR family transcriptional regulator [Lachnospiraceae bacterium]
MQQNKSDKKIIPLSETKERKKQKEAWLTIGEVAKIMNVSAKSLRYYNQIGALVPEKIDPETGYRYYSPQQLGSISMIQFCIHAGIPLQQLSKYTSGGTVDASLLLEDALDVANEKIRQLQEDITFINEQKQMIDRNRSLMLTDRFFQYELPEQKYLTEPIPPNANADSLNHAFRYIHTAAADMGVRTGFHYGKLYVYQPGKEEPKRYAALNLFGYEENSKGVLVIPGGTYTAVSLAASRIEEAADIFPKQMSENRTNYVFETEMITGTYRFGQSLYELSCTGNVCN